METKTKKCETCEKNATMVSLNGYACSECYDIQVKCGEVK